jgi:ubiquinone/menaquinone biosynthesis C-methylase UbiE
MNHQDHVGLIKDGLKNEKGIWADLGSGEGAFTLALADLLPKESKIISIDKNQTSLAIQEQKFNQLFPHRQIEFLAQDFTRNLSLGHLDGILMANSLHFIGTERQIPLLQKIQSYLKPEGKLVLVEYNTNDGNHWVPYPFRYEVFETIAKKSGFKTIKLLATIKSQFLNEIYASLAVK